MACLQSLSGTGSLRVGAAFINSWLPGRTVYLSNPTWGNHRNIFGDAGVEWKYYRYFDPESIGLDFAGMKEDLEAASDGSIVVLHGATRPPVRVGGMLATVLAVDSCFPLAGCAHNPTGIDPTKEQWQEVSDLCMKKNHIPFFDVAYQGFATGSLEEDAWAPRFFVEQGHEVMVSQSYSKNLGLYGERVGAINVVCNDSESADKCGPCRAVTFAFAGTEAVLMSCADACGGSEVACNTAETNAVACSTISILPRPGLCGPVGLRGALLADCWVLAYCAASAS